MKPFGWIKRGLAAGVPYGPLVARIAIGIVALGILTLVMISPQLSLPKVTLEVGDVNPALIRAARTVKFVDPQETEQLGKQAAERVGDVYTVLEYAMADAQGRVDRAFQLLAEAKEDAEARRKSAAELHQIPGTRESTIRWALALGKERIDELRNDAAQIVREIMAQEIRLGHEEDLRRAEEAAAQAAKELRYDWRARNLLSAICQQAIQPNRKLDPLASEKAREEARNSVQPVERTILVGDRVIDKGEKVTPRHLAMFQALGLITPGLDYSRILSSLILVCLGVLGMGVYLYKYHPQLYYDSRQLALLALMVLASLSALTLKGPRTEDLSMLTVTAGAMVIAALLNPQVAMMAAVVESVFVGLMGNSQLDIAILTLGSSLAGVACVSQIWPPSHWIRAMGILALINVGLISTVGWLGGSLSSELVRESLVGALFGLGAPLLAVGTVLLLQRPFGITSQIRLLELSNLNEPLLRRLQNEAPGTYGSSVIMANLAESAAEAVGADALLARVGSYYHDIGKLRRPYMFYENQRLLGVDNVHDRLAPSLSTLAIASHVKDGVELAKQYGLPPIIKDIIAQHHGTTLAAYFYRQALANREGEKIPEEQFRYPGPKPQTKEAAIIMLADSVQAAVMSLTDPAAGRVKGMIREIIDDRLQDGQFDECDLTFRDLDTIANRFLKVLKGIYFHTRIEYPEPVVAQKKASHGNSNQELAGSKGEPKPAKAGRSGDNAG